MTLESNDRADSTSFNPARPHPQGACFRRTCRICRALARLATALASMVRIFRRRLAMVMAALSVSSSESGDSMFVAANLLCCTFSVEEHADAQALIIIAFGTCRSFSGRLLRVFWTSHRRLPHRRRPSCARVRQGCRIAPIVSICYSLLYSWRPPTVTRQRR